MLIGNDGELQLKLDYDDSLHNVITQTMLKQEQVFEFHRRYQIQKMLMKESGGENLQSFVPSSKQSKCKSVVTEMKLGEVHLMSSSRSMKNHCQKEHRGTSNHQHRPQDLEHSSSHYAHDSVKPLPESYGCIDPQISSKMRHDAFDDSMSSMVDLELTLRPVSNTWQKQPCKDKIIGSHPQEAAHLHESNCGDLVTRPALRFAIHVTDSRAEHGIDSGSNWKHDTSERVPESSSLRNEVVSVKSTSAKRKLFASYDVGQLDLNEAPPDESCPANDQWISSPSKIGSADVSYGGGGEFGKSTLLNVPDWRKPLSNSPDEASTLDQQDVVTSGTNICASMVSSVDLVSICGSPLESKNLARCSRSFRPSSADCEMSHPDNTCQKILVSEINDKKNKEDKQHSNRSSEELLEATDSNKSPVSCKSDWITDEESSNIKKGQNGVGVSNSEFSPVLQNAMPSIEMKVQSPNLKTDKLREVDVTVRKGSVSLMYLSMERLARNGGCVPAFKEISYDVEEETPESSTESFESLMLKQPECGADEYCVSSSSAFEITSCDGRDSGVKVKRGRRMKDFRKEILPTLASLSWQEICEDMKIMELAIRSREYKKHKSKNINKSGCWWPVRSRPRVHRVVRRNYY